MNLAVELLVGCASEDSVLEREGSAIYRGNVSYGHILTRRWATDRSGQLNVDLGHAHERTVKVFDGLGGLLGRLEANITDPPLWKALDVRHMAFQTEMLPQVRL